MSAGQCLCAACRAERDGRPLSVLAVARDMARWPQPPDHFVDEAINVLVRRYPTGGNRLERALRDAVRMGWHGLHQAQQIAEK